MDRKNIVIVGHDNPDFDSFASGVITELYLRAKGYNARFFAGEGARDEVMSELGFDLSKYNIAPRDDEDIFLVDHHKTSYKNTVIGCIDHHPTAESFDYPYYYNKPSSSTALSVLRIMEKEGIDVPDSYRILVLYSVYLDTLSLKSPKFLKSDMDFINETLSRYPLDLNKIITLGLSFSDLDQPIETIAEYHLKYHTFGDTRIASSHIQSDSLSDELLTELIEYLKDRTGRESLALWILIYTDPTRDYSAVYEIADDVKLIEYNRLVSRSVDIIPEIEKRFANL